MRGGFGRGLFLQAASIGRAGGESDVRAGQALREIPEDLIIPSRLVLTEEAMTEIAERVTQEDQPTETLKALFRG